ncbi:MAG: hypothetical protein ACFB15_23135 [Cyclobacteriaceae bacterium]
MNQLFAIVTFLVFLVGCQSSSTQEADANLTQAQEIYTEAMVVHDEVMPRMEEIMRLGQTIEARMDSLRQLDSVTYADTLQQMQTVRQNLKEADEAMMQWMRGVKNVPGLEEVKTAYQDEMQIQTVDTTNIIQVQQEQKAAIEQVKQQMENSIEEAKSLLNSE